MHKNSSLKAGIGTNGIKFRTEVTSGEGGSVDPRGKYMDLHCMSKILFFRVKSEANC